MHHHHDYSHGQGSFGEQREGNRQGLLVALIITTGIMALEFIGGWIANSLALLSDAGHMLSDSASLFLSLAAMWFAARPPSPNRTYGFYRFEILAALFNAITLFLIAGFIIWEAIERFINPPEVAGKTMMVIAAIGLGANLLSAWALLRKGNVKDNVNLRSAYLHILGDALGSVGALLAGTFMILFSWYIADPIISVFVSLLILKSAYGVLTQSIHILMEGTPPRVDQKAIQEALLNIEGVLEVHDLHIWTITSGLENLTCHLRVEDHQDCQHILQRTIEELENRFSIHHSTIQIEKSGLRHADLLI